MFRLTRILMRWLLGQQCVLECLPLRAGHGSVNFPVNLLGEKLDMSVTKTSMHASLMQ